MSTKEEYSGELKCRDCTLSYFSAYGNWTINVADIRLIAEYTNSDGPYLDDYFLVFLTSYESGWHEASFYARGRDEMLKTLSTQLGATLETGLSNSTEYKSRILWPSKWNGQPLMDILPPKKNGLWRRLFDSGQRDLVPSKAMREVFGV